MSPLPSETPGSPDDFALRRRPSLIKVFVAACGRFLAIPLALGFSIFSFVYEERMAAKFHEWLHPTAGLLLPCAIGLAFVAMPLLYLNRRTRFYAAVGLGLSGLYLLAISWLQCLWVAQQSLPDFLFKLSNLLPFLGCLAGSLISLPLKGQWAELLDLVFLVVGALGGLFAYIHVMADDDLSEAEPEAPATYHLAMAIIWLQTSLIVTFFTLVSAFLLAVDDNPWPYVLIAAVSITYAVLVGLGLAYRWKIALPFSLTSQGSMAFAAYGYLMKADWHERSGQIVGLVAGAVMVGSVLAGLCLLIPENLRFYFTLAKPRGGFTQD